MKNFSSKMSQEDIRRMADNPGTKQLMKLLQQADKATVDKAVTLVSEGNYTEAQKILQKLFQTQEAAKLIAQLGGQSNG